MAEEYFILARRSDPDTGPVGREASPIKLFLALGANTLASPTCLHATRIIIDRRTDTKMASFWKILADACQTLAKSVWLTHRGIF